MQILSFEKIKLDTTPILMPCYCYRISLHLHRNEHSLNFIERTALRLIEADPSFTSPQKLARALGFPQKLEELLPKILEKIRDLNAGIFASSTPEPTLGYFFQDAWSRQLIGYVDTGEPRFLVETRRKKGEFKEPMIYFRRSAEEKENRAYCLDVPKEVPQEPQIGEFKRALRIHNQDYPFKLDAKLEDPKPESVNAFLLHCQLSVLSDGRFKLSNGFGGYSPVLLSSFERHASKELKDYILEGKKTEREKMKQNIELPFEFPTPCDDKIKRIEEEFSREQTKVCGDLFDVCERLFEDASKKIKRTIKEEKVRSNAEDMGFKNHQEIKILGLKLLLQDRDEQLKRVADKCPQFLKTLEDMHPFRNLSKHHTSQKDQKNLENLGMDTIQTWKDEVYTFISLFLRNPRRQVKQQIRDQSDRRFDATLDARIEFGNLFDDLDDQDQEAIIEINFYLDHVDAGDHENRIKEAVISNLYRLFEGIFKQLNALHAPKPRPKDALLKSLKLELGPSLSNVHELYLKSAFANGVASLGAYFLVFLSFKTPSAKEVRLMEKLICLRGHGNRINIELANLNYEELKEFKKEAFIYLKKLLEDIS